MSNQGRIQNNNAELDNKEPLVDDGLGFYDAKDKEEVRKLIGADVIDDFIEKSVKEEPEKAVIKKTPFVEAVMKKFFVKNNTTKINSKDSTLFKKIQIIFEDGLRDNYIAIDNERKIEISRNGDALVWKIIDLYKNKENISQDEYDKLAENAKVYIMYWLSSFSLPNDFIGKEVDVKFLKIAEILKLKIIKDVIKEEPVQATPIIKADSVFAKEAVVDDKNIVEDKIKKIVLATGIKVAKEREHTFRELGEIDEAEKNKIKPVISLKNIDIKYNFGKPTEYYAIKNASVDIYAGELIIFFGPSGCGKSTLVNAIAGLERPVGGSVEVMGKNILNFNYDQMADYHADTIGFVFQAYNLIESLSVEDNVIFPQMFRNTSRSERRKKAQDLLDRFEIRRHAKKSPVMLSGGQQQRVGIARALVNDPEIILADEPMGNLDSVSADIVIKIFRDLSKKENKTVILVTHNPELLSIANRIVYMKDGVIIREEVNNDVRPAEIKKKKEEEKVKDDEKIPVELKNLLRTYGSITASQLNSMWVPLKAKMITDQILQKYTREQIEFIEDVIKRRLMGIIPREEVFNLIDLPIDEGGAGLDRRSAEDLTDKIETILIEVEKIKKYVTKEISNPQESTIAEEDAVTEIRKQLLIHSEAHIIQKNIDHLENFIRLRLENKIDKNAFIDLVAKPLALDGGGFGKTTAKKFGRELELLMLIKFGEEAEARPYKK